MIELNTFATCSIATHYYHHLHYAIAIEVPTNIHQPHTHQPPEETHYKVRTSYRIAGYKTPISSARITNTKLHSTPFPPTHSPRKSSIMADIEKRETEPMESRATEDDRERQPEQEPETEAAAEGEGELGIERDRRHARHQGECRPGQGEERGIRRADAAGTGGERRAQEEESYDDLEDVHRGSPIECSGKAMYPLSQRPR